MLFDTNNLYASVYVLTVQLRASFDAAYGILEKDGGISFCGVSFRRPNGYEVAAKYILISGENYPYPR